MFKISENFNFKHEKEEIFMKNVIVGLLIFIFFIIVYFNPLHLEYLTFKLYSSEVLAEPGTIVYLPLKIRNLGLGFVKDAEVKLSNCPVYSPVYEISILPLSEKEIAIKIFVPQNLTHEIYHCNLFVKKSKLSFRIIVGTKKTLLEYRIGEIENYIRYVNMSSTNTKFNISLAESYLKKAEKFLENEDYILTEYYLDKAERSLEKERYEWHTVAIFLFFLITIFLLLSLVKEFKHKQFKYKPISFRNLHKKEEKLENKNDILKIIEDQYKLGVLSKEAYEELKEKYKKK